MPTGSSLCLISFMILTCPIENESAHDMRFTSGIVARSCSIHSDFVMTLKDGLLQVML
jgi:hypothetical protein